MDRGSQGKASVRDGCPSSSSGRQVAEERRGKHEEEAGSLES